LIFTDYNSLKEKLREKDNIKIYTEMVSDNPEFLNILFDITEKEKTAVKYMSEKIIRMISSENPEILYSYEKRVIKLLQSENNFIKWGSVITFSNMIINGDESFWEEYSDEYFNLLNTDSVEAFGNFTSLAHLITEKYPEAEKRITENFLNIDNHVFYHKKQISPECINVAKVHIIAFLILYIINLYIKKKLWILF